MRWWPRREAGPATTTTLLPPSFPLQCGWCGEVRTRPLDSPCPLCGGAWFRLAGLPGQIIDKIARQM